jgi:sulfite exporter TauE/SafE
MVNKILNVVLGIVIVILSFVVKNEKARMDELITWVESINNRVTIINENVIDVYQWGLIKNEAENVQIAAPFPFPPRVPPEC